MEGDSVSAMKFVSLVSFQDAMYALTEDGRLFKIIRNNESGYLVYREIVKIAG